MPRPSTSKVRCEDAALSAEMGKVLNERFLDSEEYTRYAYPAIFGNYYFNSSSLSSNGGFWCTQPFVVHPGETVKSPVTSNTALATVAEDQLPLTSSSVISRKGVDSNAKYTNNTEYDVYVIVTYEKSRSYGIPISGTNESVLALKEMDTEITNLQNTLSSSKRESITVNKFASGGTNCRRLHL